MKSKSVSTRIQDVIVENPKSKLKVRDSISDGQYPFFTSGAKISSHNDFICDGKNIFLATGGKAFVQYFEGKAAYSTDCYAFTTLPDTCPRFIYHFLSSKLDVIDQQMFEGAALRHLQRTKFREMLVPIPAFCEQKRIACILDHAFDGIATARTNAENNLQNAHNLYTVALEAFFRDLANFESVELDTVIELLTDYHANGSYETLRDNVELKNSEDYAWMVRSTDFEKQFKNGMRYISEPAYHFLKKSQLFGGEIIMSKIGNAGKVYLMPKVARPCSLAMNLFLIRLDDQKVNKTYVYRFLKSERGEKQILSKLKGAATQTITKKEVRSLLLPLPSRSVQDRFVSEIEDIEVETQRLESIYQKKLIALDDLKKSLLHQAFYGQL